MTGSYRPARTIEPGWHVHLADVTPTSGTFTGGRWIAVLARLDTITDTGRRRVWFLGDDGLAAVAGADELVFSRDPHEAAAAHAAGRPR
ncbi:MAG TPA: hypothetical protein VFV66_21710 [Nonomuraea sp.]|nr:hypothetical protein [Nonomuraea sp.]